MTLEKPIIFRLNALVVLLLLLLGGVPATAQPGACSITLQNDTTICQGETVLLQGPAGFPSYQWSTGANTQDITVGSSGTYSLEVSYPTGQMAVNGDFTAGNTGFATQFSLNSNLNANDGTYWVGTNAASHHPQFIGTGNGRFLMVNAGWQEAGWEVWCQTHDVCPGQTYALSLRAVSLASQGAPSLMWYINGEPTFDNHQTILPQNNWQTFTSSWTAPAGTTSATFCIEVTSGHGVGNDIGLDDISISSIIELTDQVQVTVTPLPPVNFGPDQNLCFGETLLLDATVPGGTYLWQDGSTDATFQVTQAGTYDVTVTANGCTNSDAITVGYNSELVVDLGPETTLCAGETLLLDAFQPGGTTYLWQDGSTASSLLVDAPGSYSVTITRNGCSATASINVAYNPLPVVDLGPDPVICAGDQVILDASTPSATYLWQDGSSAATYTATDAGTYSVAVTVNGCTSSDQVDLSVTPLPVVDLGPDLTVCPGTTVTFDAAVPGGSYLWQDGSTGSTLATSQAGTYSVTVTANGCSATDAVDLALFTLPIVDLGPDQTICAGTTASFSVNVPGATYLWSTGSTANTISPANAGDYWVDVVRDGCTVRDSVQLFVPPLPVVDLGPAPSVCPGATANVNATQPGGTYLWSTGATTGSTDLPEGDHAVTVTVNGCSTTASITVGSLPVPLVNLGPDITLCSGDQAVLNASLPGASYLWSTGAMSPAITVDAPGTFSVTVTDANGCTGTDAVDVSVLSPLAINLGPDQTICAGTSASFSVNAPGATYLWNTGSTANTISAANAGDYWVDVTVNGCTERDSVQLFVTPLPVVDLGPAPSVCPGATANVNATQPGGTYLWSTGATTGSTDLPEGDHAVTVTVNGCSTTASITVGSLPVPQVDLGPDITLCSGDQAVLNAALPGASHVWNTGATSSTLTVDAPGTYSVTVTDANGCTGTDAVDVSVLSPLAINLGPDQTICAGTSASFSVNAPGATYLWNTGSTANTISAANAGDYWVDVTVNGCTERDSVQLFVTPLPVVDLGPAPSVCPGATAAVDATQPGGTYLWSTGATTGSTDLPEGDHTVTVTVNGCSSTASITVGSLPVPPVDLGPDITLCNGDQAVLNATLPGASYLWSTGATSPTLTVDATNTFSVTVTDANGCTGTDAVEVTVVTPMPVDLGPDQVLCEGAAVTLDAAVAGGSYLWSTGETTATIQVNASGTYAVEVVQGSCTVTGSVTLTFQSAPTVDLGPDLTLCPGDVADLDATTSVVSYLWNTGAITPVITVSSAGSYSVQVTDAAGCTGGDAIEVAVVTPDALDLGADTAICAGATLVLNAGLPGATYLWSNGSVAPSLSVSSAGTYWVEVTQGNCSVSDTITVDLLPTPALDLGPDVTLCEGEEAPLDASVPGGSYLWNTGATTATLVVDQPGTYSVTATAGGCSATDEILLTVVPLPVVDLGGDVAICPGTTATFQAGIPGASYLWHDGSTLPEFSTAEAGAVSVTVTVAGCSASDAATVSLLEPPQPDLGNDTTLCAGASLLLDVTEPGASYLWDDGSTGPTRSVDAAGTYWVRMERNSCETSDTLVVDLFDVTDLDLGDALQLCQGESATLSTGLGNAIHLWNTGATGSSITVEAAGTYWVDVLVTGCPASDTVVVEVIDLAAPDLGPDRTICSDEMLMLSVAPGDASVLWNTGSTENSIPVSSSGTYSATLTRSGCSASDAVVITVLERVDELPLPSEATLCPGATLMLDAGTLPDVSFLWNTGQSGPVLLVTSTGTYTVTATGPCVDVTATVSITEDDCEPFIFVPNAFTPDGDGINDVFRPSVEGPVVRYVFDIFNRRGQLIYSTENVEQGWDGMVDGIMAPDGIYAWTLTYKAITGRGVDQQRLFGHVTLLR